MRRMFGAVALILAAALAAGCSEDPPDDTQPEAGDGKYHPPPNGTHTTEALACNALVNGHSKRMLALGCTGTSRTCPGFLRSNFGASCLEYDQGSVDGCLAYYDMQKSCEELAPALEGCMITSYPGTMSAGCVP